MSGVFRAGAFAFQGTRRREPSTFKSNGLVEGRYRIERSLCAHGHSVLFKAHDHRLGRDVVIKKFASRRLMAAALERRRREASVTALLGDSHFPVIYEVSVSVEGDHYFVMESIEGPTLAERLSEGSVSALEVNSLLTCLSRILDAADGVGLVARHLRAEMLRMRADGTLIFFGMRCVDSDSREALDVVDGSSPPSGEVALGPLVPDTDCATADRSDAYPDALASARWDLIALTGQLLIATTPSRSGLGFTPAAALGTITK